MGPRLPDKSVSGEKLLEGELPSQRGERRRVRSFGWQAVVAPQSLTGRPYDGFVGCARLRSLIRVFGDITLPQGRTPSKERSTTKGCTQKVEPPGRFPIVDGNGDTGDQESARARSGLEVPCCAPVSFGVRGTGAWASGCECSRSIVGVADSKINGGGHVGLRICTARTQISVLTLRNPPCHGKVVSHDANNERIRPSHSAGRR